MLLLTLATMAFSPLQANAGNTSHTTAIGAAGGALIGQAIGHDTEATLIGTAVGGVVGYMVGNKMDKNDTTCIKTSRVVEPYYPRRHHSYEKRYEERAVCRETEILAMVGGRPEQVVTMACLENGRWIIQDGVSRGRQDVVIQNITYRPVFHKKKKRKKHYRSRRYDDYYPRWERVAVW